MPIQRSRVRLNPRRTGSQTYAMVQSKNATSDVYTLRCFVSCANHKTIAHMQCDALSQKEWRLMQKQRRLPTRYCRDRIGRKHKAARRNARTSLTQLQTPASSVL